MKKIAAAFIALMAVAALSAPAHATLLNRSGGLIYDTDLNITWLQDANFAMSSGHDADGAMPWAEAMEWAENLVYQGYDDWRLPSALGKPYSGYYPSGYGEYGHLYYTELGNAMDSFTNSGPFLNIQPAWYATQEHRDTSDPDLYDFYTFNFDEGNQAYAIDRGFYAWAVRDGDSAPVPEPSTIVLLGAGLAGVALRKRLLNAKEKRTI